MTAYYNEHDPYAAAWLRNLIAAGHIAPGVVDERSIEDVRPDELRGYTQCHFFAGIGVWSYALRRAGWPDERPVWTGSCPCQPFSAAGKGAGVADERHLWPAFHHLIRERRPGVVFGEQVASKDGLGWLDLVHTDMENEGYAFGALDLCAAGIGAPHIRQRLWWVAKRMANAEHDGLREHRHSLGGAAGAGESQAQQRQRLRVDPADGSTADRLGDDDDARLEGLGGGHQTEGGRLGAVRPVAEAGESGGMGDTELHGQPAARQLGEPQGEGRVFKPEGSSTVQRACPTNGHWRDADWLFCRDGKWRPVEPRPQSMVDGSAESLGRVLPGLLEDLELEVAEWSLRYQADAGEALHDLRGALSARAQREWPVGGLPSLHGAPFLLAFLRELQEQGWAFAERLPSESAEVAQERLRVLRDNGAASRASRGRGLDEQQPGECADPMRILSSILARYAQEAWGEAYRTYAPIGFPLEHGAKSRVVRLRAYGNAIVAQVAQTFIEAYLEKSP